MPHPGIPYLEAIIAEETTILADMQAQVAALNVAEGTGERYLDHFIQANGLLARARDCRLIIRLAEIALAALPPTP